MKEIKVKLTKEFPQKLIENFKLKPLISMCFIVAQGW